MIRLSKGMAAAGAAVLIGLWSGAASAQEGAAFFDGKTVNYIVATDPGGGYDTNGRLVAEFMQKHLPGSTFVVQNMPGAGHLVGTNYIYASEPDGLTIGTFNTGLIYSQLAGKDGIKFDLAKMSWIGKVASDPRVIVMSKQSGIESYEQLKNLKEPIKFAAAGAGSASTIEATMLINTLEPADPGHHRLQRQRRPARHAPRRGAGHRRFALDLPAVRRRGAWQVHRPDRRLGNRRAAAVLDGRQCGGPEGDRPGRIAEQHLAADGRADRIFRRIGWRRCATPTRPRPPIRSSSRRPNRSGCRSIPWSATTSAPP